MGKKTSFPGVIQCIGGGLDLGDINKGGEATVNTVIRECEEEIGIGISKEDIIDNKKYVYLREKMSTIGFCYIVNLKMNHTELLKIFETHKVSHNEIEELILVGNSSDNIISFCQNSMLVDYLKDVVLDFSGIDVLGQAE